MKLNSGGIKLCVVYTAYVALLLALVYFTADPKGRFFYGSLTSLPAGLIVAILGSFRLIRVDSWINGPIFFYPMNLLVMYLTGWGLSVAKRKLS